MSDMEKIIEKAVERGLMWRGSRINDVVIHSERNIKLRSDEDMYAFTVTWNELIFSTGFLKAYFGEHLVCKECGKPDDENIECIKQAIHRSEIDFDWRVSWQYHAQQLVLAEDRLEYLRRFIY